MWREDKERADPARSSGMRSQGYGVGGGPVTTQGRPTPPRRSCRVRPAPAEPPVQTEPLDDEHAVPAGPAGTVRGARCGLSRSAVENFHPQHLRGTADAQLLGSLRVQAGVGDQLGDDQQDVFGSRSAVGARRGEPAPVVECLAGEIAGRRHDAADLPQRQRAPLSLDRLGGGCVGAVARALRLAAEVARLMLPGGAHQRFTSPIHHVAIEQIQIQIQIRDHCGRRYRSVQVPTSYRVCRSFRARGVSPARPNRDNTHFAYADRVTRATHATPDATCRATIRCPEPLPGSRGR